MNLVYEDPSTPSSLSSSSSPSSSPSPTASPSPSSFSVSLVASLKIEADQVLFFLFTFFVYFCFVFCLIYSPTHTQARVFCLCAIDNEIWAGVNDGYVYIWGETSFVLLFIC